MTTELREYQQVVYGELRDQMKAGYRRLLLVMPTGAGKGTLIAKMIASSAALGKRSLFVVAGRQLVEEFSVRLSSQYGVPHGVIMGDHHLTDAGQATQVASIDTLRSRIRHQRDLPPADLVFVDEADLARAERFESVLAQYPKAFVIGQTATPIRADGKGLGGKLFERMVRGPGVRELIDRGYLSDYSCFALQAINTAGISRSGGEFNARELDARLAGAEGDKLAGNVVEQWHKLAGGRRTLVCAVSIRHSLELTERFRNERHHGGPIAAPEHMDGTMEHATREGIFARLRNGETTHICQVGVVNRGVDCPPLEVCQLARPIGSLAYFLQAVGRVFRTSDATGKKNALIIDHGGNLMRHGFPCDERDWSLADGDQGQRTGEEEILTLRCGQCLAIFPRAVPACPHCGWIRPLPEGGGEGRLIEEEANARPISMEELKALRGDVSDPEKIEFLRAELAEAARHPQWKPKTPLMRFKSKYGFWPGPHLINKANKMNRDAGKAAA